MNTKIPMPARIAALPVHTNGYPIPFFVHQVVGEPVDFRITSQKAKFNCARFKVCWICGQPLGRLVVFIGGPISTENGVYGDGPSHRECSEYALQVCPYLAISQVERREKGLDLEKVGFSEHHVIEKPEKFAQLVTRDWLLMKVKEDYLFRAEFPVEIVWWRSGHKL